MSKNSLQERTEESFANEHAFALENKQWAHARELEKTLEALEYFDLVQDLAINRQVAMAKLKVHD